MRDERARNDSTYTDVSYVQNLVSDLSDISLTKPINNNYDASVD